MATTAAASSIENADVSHTASSSYEYQIHSSFSEIADSYDGFILDQFGVMHNGSHALDGADHAVRELARRGKRLIILSNSSSPAAATIAKLPRLGFDPEDFCGAVTSGEEASHHVAFEYGSMITQEEDGPTKKKKALWITWKCPKTPSPMDFLQQCGISVAASVEEADFVLLHGVEVVRGPGDDGVAEETSLGSFLDTGDMSEVIEPLLKTCLARNLPMVCANPDFVMVRPDGTQAHMPGKIAQLYEEMGGSCTTFGKPHVPHFEACLHELGLPRDRVAHVGDSLHHDVAGANATGIASVFVVGGIHREEIGSELGKVPRPDALERVLAKHGRQRPTHVVPLLKM